MHSPFFFLVLTPAPSWAHTTKLRGGLQIGRQRDKDRVRMVGCLLLYWRILLVYSLSFLVCPQPLMHSEWLRTDPTESFSRALRGQKSFLMKWPTKRWHLVGIKVKETGKPWKRNFLQHGTLHTVQRWREHKHRFVWCIFTLCISHWCFCIHDPHSLLIPYYKSMPAALSTSPTARLTGFFTSWRGKVEKPLQHYKHAWYC